MTLPPPRPPTVGERTRPFVLAAIAALTVLAVTLGFIALTNALTAQRTATRVSQAQTAEATKIAELAQQQAAENQAQLARDAALFCGGFVPISQAPLTVQTSVLARSIITWAKTGAATLKCPGR